MSHVYHTKRFVETKKNVGRTGVGATANFTVAVDFLPDFIRTEFEDKGDAAAQDYIYWEMAAGLTVFGVGTYTITVTYQITKDPRDIKVIATKLPKDAELLAH